MRLHSPSVGIVEVVTIEAGHMVAPAPIAAAGEPAGIMKMKYGSALSSGTIPGSVVEANVSPIQLAPPQTKFSKISNKLGE